MRFLLQKWNNEIWTYPRRFPNRTIFFSFSFSVSLRFNDFDSFFLVIFFCLRLVANMRSVSFILSCIDSLVGPSNLTWRFSISGISQKTFSRTRQFSRARESTRYAFFVNPYVHVRFSSCRWKRDVFFLVSFFRFLIYLHLRSLVVSSVVSPVLCIFFVCVYRGRRGCSFADATPVSFEINVRSRCNISRSDSTFVCILGTVYRFFMSSVLIPRCCNFLLYFFFSLFSSHRPSIMNVRN